MKQSFQVNKPLSELSTLAVGGPAHFFKEVTSVEEMQIVLKECDQMKIPFLVIGKGSNCLFDDRGFEGLVILNKIHFSQFDWPMIHVGAGYSFSRLGVQTARAGWSGLEFASGIPGSVGGAVYMNAGANGSETFKSLVEVSFVNERGELEVFQKSAISHAYRFTGFHERRGAIVSAKFLLEPSEVARKEQLTIVEYRTKTQPYQDKSAGCVFKNSTCISAGALIEKCGLKGHRIGGAEVSTMHANFIVNKENATSKDVLALATYVQRVVKEKTGIDLEMEIRYIASNPQVMEKDVSC